MKLTHLVSAAAVALLAGCASSPVQPPGNGPTAAEAGVLLAGTAGGAAAGNAINSKYGAPVGAAVGLGAGLLFDKLTNDRERGIWAEAYAEGERQGRLELLRQQAANQGSSPTSGYAPAPAVHYEADTVAGVRYTPRDTTSDSLVEPNR